MRPNPKRYPRLIAFAAILSVAASARLCPAVVLDVPTAGPVEHSRVYEVAADGKPLAVRRCDGRAGPASYVHVILDAPATFTVKSASAGGRWDVASTERITSAGTRETLTLPLEKPCKILIQTNDAEQLYIFADPPESGRPDANSSDVITITARGADSSGGKLATAAIQAAIDELTSRPKGGVLLFPPGVYRTGTIRIGSRVTVYLAPGARLQGSSNPADYPFDAGNEESPDRTQDIRSRLVLFDGVEDAALLGLGEIDGAAQVIRDQHKRVPNLIRVRRSRNVRIEGVLLRRAAGWNTHIFHSDNVAVRNVKILSNWSDGLDADNSRNVAVEDVLISSYDDSFVIKATGFDGRAGLVANVSLRHAVLWTQKSGIKIGTETLAATMENFAFENATVAGARGALVIQVRDGALVRNLSYRDIRIRNAQQAVQWDIRKRNGIGRIENAVLENVSVTGSADSSLAGYDEQHAIRNVRFLGYRMYGHLVLSARDARIDLGKYVEDVTFGTAATAPARR